MKHIAPIIIILISIEILANMQGRKSLTEKKNSNTVRSQTTLDNSCETFFSAACNKSFADQLSPSPAMSQHDEIFPSLSAIASYCECNSSPVKKTNLGLFGKKECHVKKNYCERFDGEKCILLHTVYLDKYGRCCRSSIKALGSNGKTYSETEYDAMFRLRWIRIYSPTGENTHKFVNSFRSTRLLKRKPSQIDYSKIYLKKYYFYRIQYFKKKITVTQFDGDSSTGIESDDGISRRMVFNSVGKKIFDEMFLTENGYDYNSVQTSYIPTITKDNEIRIETDKPISFSTQREGSLLVYEDNHKSRYVMQLPEASLIKSIREINISTFTNHDTRGIVLKTDNSQYSFINTERTQTFFTGKKTRLHLLGTIDITQFRNKSIAQIAEWIANKKLSEQDETYRFVTLGKDTGWCGLLVKYVLTNWAEWNNNILPEWYTSLHWYQTMNVYAAAQAHDKIDRQRGNHGILISPKHVTSIDGLKEPIDSRLSAGDIVIYDRDHDGYPHHIGLVTEVKGSPGNINFIKTVEGNIRTADDIKKNPSAPERIITLNIPPTKNGRWSEILTFIDIPQN